MRYLCVFASMLAVFASGFCAQGAIYNLGYNNACFLILALLSVANLGSGLIIYKLSNMF